MRVSLAFAVSVFAAVASAQSSTTSSSSSSSSSSSAASSSSSSMSMTASSTITASSSASQVMPPVATQSFNPAAVNSTVRSNWCTAQLNTCPEICDGSTSENTCDPNALTYGCICQNGTAPDATAYMSSLPFFICQETFIQCIQSHPNDLDGQNQCTANEQCGKLNATAAEASSSSAAAASSASSTSAASGSAAGTSTASASSSSKTHNAAVPLNTELTTGAFAGLLFAVFKLLL